jgi:hypothetical protein
MSADVYAVVARALARFKYPEFDATNRDTRRYLSAAQESAARVAIDALAGMGDVSDEDRAEVINVAQRNGRDGGILLGILLARARATDQARIAELEAKVASLHATGLALVAERDALRAENERMKDGSACDTCLADLTALSATVERVRALAVTDSVRWGHRDVGVHRLLRDLNAVLSGEDAPATLSNKEL